MRKIPENRGPPPRAESVFSEIFFLPVSSFRRRNAGPTPRRESPRIRVRESRTRPDRRRKSGKRERPIFPVPNRIYEREHRISRPCEDRDSSSRTRRPETSEARFPNGAFFSNEKRELRATDRPFPKELPPILRSSISAFWPGRRPRKDVRRIRNAAPSRKLRFPRPGPETPREEERPTGRPIKPTRRRARRRTICRNTPNAVFS